MFTDEDSLARCKYDWLVEGDKDEGDADEVRDKIDSIFLERSCILY